MILLLAGCAARHEPGNILPGTTTHAEIVAQYGAVKGVGMHKLNGIPLYSVSYEFSADHVFPAGVTPAHALGLTYKNDVVVGYLFIPSFGQDSPNFDERKISQIVRNATRKADVIALLGKPQGEYIYPLVKGTESRGMVYLFGEAGSASAVKRLVVTLGPDGVVTDVEIGAYPV